MLLMRCFSFSVTVPDAVPKLTLILSHRNGIKVTCTSNGNFNGPKMYIVQLYVGDKHVPKETSEKCPFEFKDLSYLTNYKVKVCIIPNSLSDKTIPQIPLSA